MEDRDALLNPVELAPVSTSPENIARRRAGRWRLWRYDIFISYRRSDASLYVKALVEELRALDYACHWDSEELPPGEPLTESLQRALARSAVLVLIASPDAPSSDYIREEVNAFANTGRRILPISIGGALQRMMLPVVQERDLVWVDEAGAALEAGHPTRSVVEAIDRSFTIVRRNANLRRRWIGTAFLFCLLAGVAILLLTRSANRANDAQRAANAATVRAHAESIAASMARRAADSAAQVAREEQRRARAARLAADAIGLYNYRENRGDTTYAPDQIAVSMRLAYESLRESPNAPAERLLRALVQLMARPVGVWRAPGGVSAVTVAFSSPRVIIASGDGRLWRWDWERHNVPYELAVIPAGRRVTSLAFDARDTFVAVGTSAGVYAIDAQRTGGKLELVVPDVAVRDVFFRGFSGEYVIAALGQGACSADGSLLIAEARQHSGRTRMVRRTTLAKPTCELYPLPLGDSVLVRNADSVALYSLLSETPRRIAAREFRSQGGMRLAVIDSRFVAGAAVEGKVRFVALDSTASAPPPLSIPFSHTGYPAVGRGMITPMAIATYNDKPFQTIHVVRTYGGSEEARMIMPGDVRRLYMAADGRYIVAADALGAIHIWDVNYDSKLLGGKTPLSVGKGDLAKLMEEAQERFPRSLSPAESLRYLVERQSTKDDR